MDCQQCREAVSAHLDGEPAGAPREVVEDHLARCAPCRAFAGAARRVGRLVRVRPAEPVPDDAGALLAALGLPAPAPVPDAGAVPAPAAGPDLVSVPGCCAPVTDPGPVPVAAAGTGACGCAASCGCGCQQGAPCRCGVRAA